MPAMVTRIRSAASHAVVLAHRSGTLLGVALCRARRKAHIHHALKTGIIGREFLIELSAGITKLFGDGLSAVHGVPLS